MEYTINDLFEIIKKYKDDIKVEDMDVICRILSGANKNEAEDKIVKTIPLKNFLLLHNFRYSVDGTNEDLNCINVRIYLDESDKDNWFEFGMYDYGTLHKKIKLIENSLNDDLLNLYVYSFNYDEDDDCVLKIYVSKDNLIKD